MKQIQQVTSDYKQRRTVILDDGTTFILRTEYKPLQQGWFITELIYKDFTLRGVRIVNSPNLLHQFHNQIPFGIACYTKGDREPMLQQDFSSGASKLYVLTAEETLQYARHLSGI
jgi:hypothetical protein